ncbi:PepSY-associated TM helix domain-containing protein [Marinoscillum furvescens]|uniref:Putative iron-regulated membrane protein n=1 Tax=Marinoscillum furvescens DSM 4134 TaxID=1122208 RepID=A0A3D9L644_MARFU|nr:PepSY-associated TM helix domain-containing protein [Marinoscillum furvescens]REE00448.1 putative iron-regulated membrane protein [Marinoscillum furvescens DSM 4134]
MSKRIYNVLFHTHTVSGLVISVALYVIFFAGSISFFRDDIINWERDQPIIHHTLMAVDFDALMDTLEARHELYGRTVTLSQIHQERRVTVDISPSADTSVSPGARRRAFFYHDPVTQKSYSYFEDFTLGEFIYRLHFFAQIPYPYGYLLSGFVALFFLFAIVTGVIIHWKKIVTNFFVFRPGKKLKTIWTDAHTALGVLGLPFQFVYAMTGAALIIGGTVMLGMAGEYFFEGQSDKAAEALEVSVDPKPFEYNPTPYDFSYNELMNELVGRWEHVLVDQVQIQNYGDASMQLIVNVAPEVKHKMLGFGQIVYDFHLQKMRVLHEPFHKPPFVSAFQSLMIQLHYGNFGGYALKVLYFLFGIITCFVILSGVLIWVEARDKKSNDDWKRKANHRVANIFVAISLSMYPVTAFSFLVVKLLGSPGNPEHYLLIYKAFMIPWLLLSVVFSIKGNRFFTTRYCLLSGGLMGLLVPVVNGCITQNWIWNTFHAQQIQLFVVDAFWLITSIIVLMVVFGLRSADVPTNKKSGGTS